MQKTEERNPRTMNIDKMDTLAMLQVMNEENYNAVKAVEKVLPQVEQAVDAVSIAFKNGGRLFYIGAGTSGRLGVVDASECPPTFGVDPGMVVGIIAGGVKCLYSASENAEDKEECGIEDLAAYNIQKEDVVCGISVAGNAAYVLGALKHAASKGCITIGITSNDDSKLAMQADIAICPDTGAEVITGSTRLKAGTAQKLILNMISTCSMIKQGYVYENLMINLKPSNKKLTDRVIRIVCEITRVQREKAVQALEKSEWDIREAIEYIKSKKGE